MMIPNQVRQLYGTHRRETAILRPNKVQNNGVIRGGNNEKLTSAILRAGDMLDKVNIRSMMEKKRINNYHYPPAAVLGELGAIEPKHITTTRITVMNAVDKTTNQPANRAISL